MKEFIKHKFSYLLFFLLLVSLFVSVYGQEWAITLNLSKVPLNTALKEVEKQTSMSIVYNSSDIDINRIVSIKVKNESLTNVMSILFKGTNVSFSIVNNHIVLSANNKKEEQQKKSPCYGQVKIQATQKLFYFSIERIGSHLNALYFAIQTGHRQYGSSV